jgi:hypothetical protein
MRVPVWYELDKSMTELWTRVCWFVILVFLGYDGLLELPALCMSFGWSVGQLFSPSHRQLCSDLI